MATENKDETVFRPIDVDSLQWKTYSRGGARFGRRACVLSDTSNPGLHIGVVIEELAPGKQSVPFHYHLLEEEHILMLEGELTLRLGDERLQFRAGQFVTFPAGVERAHCLLNEGDAPARYLLIGDKNPNEICMYPDSGKVQVRGFGRAIYRHGPRLDYWDGEQSDLPVTRDET
jgi:uncharacterized cupin superfamily protein